MSEFTVIQQALAGEASHYEEAAGILLSDALEIITSFGSDVLPWQEMLWAAQLAIEEVFGLTTAEFTEENVHTAMRQKILRVINGLDRHEMAELRERPDAFVNRVFGTE